MRRLSLLLLFFAFCIANAAGQSFTVSTSPRIQTQTSDTIVYQVVAAASGGFKASVFFRAWIPTIPQADVRVLPTKLNYPYSDTARIVVHLTGSFADTHAVVIEGTNASLVARDTVRLVPKARPAWRIYDSTNAPMAIYSYTSLVVDRNSTGWIGGYDGLVGFDGTTWTVFDTIGVVSSLAVDSSNNLWVMSSKEELGRLSNGAWTWISYPDAALRNSAHITGGPRGARLAADGQGNLWVMGLYYGLARYDGMNWTTYGNDDLPFSLMKMNSIAVDHQGVLWLAAGQSLYKFDDGFWTEYTGSDLWPNLDVQTLQVDPAGNLWTLSLTGYLGMVATDGSYQLFNDFSNGGFPGYGIGCHTFDTLGRLWVGYGTNYSPGAAAKWEGVGFGTGTTYNQSNSGVPDRSVQMIAAGPDLSIWMLTWTRGLAILDGTQSGLIAAPLSVDNAAAPVSTTAALTLYPNPTRDRAEIAVNLSQRSHLRVSIVNTRGEEVVRAFDAMSDVGRRVLSIDCRELPPGGYFVQAISDNLRQTRAMVVVR